MSVQPRTRRAVVLHMVPTAMTVLAICAGLTSFKVALDGRPGIAVVLLAVAAVLDGLDGRVARMLDAASEAGKRIDSLADAVNFGVAPALVVYVSLLSDVPAGWVVALLYAACIALRLARFNALLDDGSLPAYSREFFVGMPAPAGAGMAILPLVAKVQFGDGWWVNEWFLTGWLVGCSALVVSHLPMRKLPAVTMRPSLVAVVSALLVVAVVAAVRYPYIVIMVVNVAYLCHIPFSVRSHRWLAANPEAWGDKPGGWRRTRHARPHRRSWARLRLHRPGGTT